MAEEKEGNVLEQLLSDGTSKELLKLKKKLAKDITNKLGITIFKKSIINYLVNEGSLKDLVGDKIKESIFGKKGLNIVTPQLEELRNRISEANTEEALEKLRTDVFEEIGGKKQEASETSESNNSSASTTTTTSTTPTTSTESSSTQSSNSQNTNNTTTTTSTTPTTSTESSSTSSSDNESHTASNVESAKVGELAKVGETKEARMKWLFPSGTPKSKEEMQKYLKKIDMPIRTADGKESKVSLNIHAKLEGEIREIFKEMYEKNIPVNPSKTGAFCWRKVRRGNKMSQHSYGSAIDVNYDVNGGVYGKTDRNSPYFNGKETVSIWKRHGFFRGGDWSAKANDPMHFGLYNG